MLAAPSAKRALEICMGFHKCLVLSDVSMPEMGGKELADCISDSEDPVTGLVTTKDPNFGSKFLRKARHRECPLWPNLRGSSGIRRQRK